MKAIIYLTLLLSFPTFVNASEAHKIIGHYEGSFKILGFSKKCFLQINDKGSSDVSFKVQRQKDLFSEMIINYHSIRGYKKDFYTQAIDGKIFVKIDYSIENQAYYDGALYWRAEMDQGEVTEIDIDSDLNPTSYTWYNREDSYTCNNLKRVN